MFVDGLKRLLQTRREFNILGEAYDGASALALLEKNQIDVLILDINMPGMDGMEVTKQVHRNFPDTKVLILSMYTDTNFAQTLMEQGASAYLIKNTSKEELFEAIHCVMDNGRYISKEVLKKAPPPSENNQASEHFGKKYNLTKREGEILKLLIKGKTSTEIAASLFLSTYTVDTHRKNLLRKLNVKNASSLVRFAIVHDLMKA